MTMTKETATFTESEVEHRLQTAEGISAVAGHFLDDEEREILRQSIRGELTPEQFEEIAYARAMAPRN